MVFLPLPFPQTTGGGGPPNADSPALPVGQGTGPQIVAVESRLWPPVPAKNSRVPCGNNHPRPTFPPQQRLGDECRKMLIAMNAPNAGEGSLLRRPPPCARRRILSPNGYSHLLLKPTIDLPSARADSNIPNTDAVLMLSGNDDWRSINGTRQPRG